MTVLNDIREALETGLGTVTGIPSAANRAYQNADFEPTPGTTWVRSEVVFDSARPSSVGSTPEILHQGSYLVTIYTPRNQGAAAAYDLADAIRSTFDITNTLTADTTTVRFRWAEPRTPVPDGSWFLCTVAVGWYAYANS